MDDQGRGDAFDVIVVGGGPGGSTAAWRLAKRGLRPLVLDAGAHLGDRRFQIRDEPLAIARDLEDNDTRATAVWTLAGAAGP